MKVSSRDAVRVFKALSDVTRVEIVQLLGKSPRNVTELTSLVGVSQPKVSRHLKILRDAGLLRDVRKGKWVWYELVLPGKGEPAGVAATAITSFFLGGGLQERGTPPQDWSAAHRGTAVGARRVGGAESVSRTGAGLHARSERGGVGAPPTRTLVGARRERGAEAAPRTGTVLGTGLTLETDTEHGVARENVPRTVTALGRGTPGRTGTAREVDTGHGAGRATRLSAGAGVDRAGRPRMGRGPGLSRFKDRMAVGEEGGKELMDKQRGGKGVSGKAVERLGRGKKAGKESSKTRVEKVQKPQQVISAKKDLEDFLL